MKRLFVVVMVLVGCLCFGRDWSSLVAPEGYSFESTEEFVSAKDFAGTKFPSGLRIPQTLVMKLEPAYKDNREFRFCFITEMYHGKNESEVITRLSSIIYVRGDTELEVDCYYLKDMLEIAESVNSLPEEVRKSTTRRFMGYKDTLLLWCFDSGTRKKFPYDIIADEKMDFRHITYKEFEALCSVIKQVDKYNPLVDY